MRGPANAAMPRHGASRVIEDTTVGSRRREEAENAGARSIRLLTSAATIVCENYNSQAATLK